jgi:hypothetical protein
MAKINSDILPFILPKAHSYARLSRVSRLVTNKPYVPRLLTNKPYVPRLVRGTYATLNNGFRGQAAERRVGGSHLASSI